MSSMIPWKRNDGERGSSSGMPVTQLRSDWDRLFDRFLDDFWGPSSGVAAHGLPLDVHETDGEIVLSAEIPGIDPQDIDVSLTGDVLTISGQKEDRREDRGARYHHSERRFGSFQRSVRLPIPVEPDQVQAECKNGLLTVTLQKAESTRPRKIDVRGA